MNAILAAALAYADRGWPVHPLRGKVAVVADWPNAASVDREQINAWWTHWPAANVAIVTGSRSGLAVLDIDPRNGGLESLADLEATHGWTLPDTLTARTGGQGLHMIYANLGGAISCGNDALGPGLDIKGEAGYIVAPPSVHPSGVEYRWADDCPWKHPITTWPAQLDRLLEPKAVVTIPRQSHRSPTPSRGSYAALIRKVAEEPHGNQHNILVWAAKRTVVEGIVGRYPWGQVAHALIDASVASGHPEREAKSTVKSVFNKAGVL